MKKRKIKSHAPGLKNSSKKLSLLAILLLVAPFLLYAFQSIQSYMRAEIIAQENASEMPPPEAPVESLLEEQPQESPPIPDPVPSQTEEAPSVNSPIPESEEPTGIPEESIAEEIQPEKETIETPDENLSEDSPGSDAPLENVVEPGEEDSDLNSEVETETPDSQTDKSLGESSESSESTSEEIQEKAEEEVLEESIYIDDLSDQETLIEGELLPELVIQSAPERQGAIQIAQVPETKSEIEVISLDEALETVFSLTTREEDLELAVLKSILKEEKDQFKEAIVENPAFLRELKNSISFFENSDEKLDLVLSSAEFQKFISETLEDDQDIELFLSRMMTEQKKEEILDKTIANALNSETPLSPEQIISEEIKNEIDRFNLEAVLMQRLKFNKEIKEKLFETLNEDAELVESRPIEDPLVQVTVGGKGKTYDIPTEDIHFETDALTMVLDLPREFEPGVYKANVEFTNPITGAKDIVVQDLLWGVLAMNPDKDVYQASEQALLAIGVLDDKGRPVCDATVTLEVTNPDGSTRDVTVENTGKCSIFDPKNILPDYEAEYGFGENGTYSFKTTATLSNGKTRFMISQVNVESDPSFFIQREAATRLYPVGLSPMSLSVYFAEDFSGQIQDTVPADFEVFDVPDVQLSTDSQSKILTWDIEARAGEIKNVAYFFDAPDISPAFFTVGPAQLMPAKEARYIEQRSWQIANDEPIIEADSTSNLRLHWKFADGSGSFATDFSANGLTGTLTNMESADWITSTPTASNYNPYALDFDGVNEYVTRADPASGVLDFTDLNDLSISGWFNRDTFTTDDTIVAKSNGQLGTDTGYNLYIDDATDRLIFNLADGTDLYTITSASSFTSTGWNHFVVVWDQDNATNSEIYINGVDNNATDTGTLGNIGSLANALAFRTAAESDAGNPFDGKIDDIRVYNKVLSQSEITILARGNKAGGVTGGVLWLKSTGMVNDGTNVHSWEDDSGLQHSFVQNTPANRPLYIIGTANFNPVVRFDGTNDVLNTSTFTQDLVDVYAVIRNTDTGNNERTFFGVGTPDVGVSHHIAHKANNSSGQSELNLFQDGGDSVSVVTTNIDNQFFLYNGQLDALRNATGVLYINGQNLATDTGSGLPATMGSTALGAGYTSGTTLSQYFQGDIAEIINFNNPLTGADKQKVEAYLALKYGITLDQSATGGGNSYMNSAGTVIWSADGSDVFEYDIAGIIQDDTSNLDQTKSKSVNSDEILTVGDATSQGDLDSMTWANNNGAASWTSTGAPSGYKILSRQWRTTESAGDIGTVDLEFDVADSDFDVPALQGGSGYYFIHDSNDDGLLSDETPVLMKDDGTSGDDTASDNKWTQQQAFSGTSSTREFTIATFVDPVPVVSDASISVNGGSGTGSAFIVGDQVIVTWNGNTDGNSLSNITSVTADVSGWGGSATATMTDNTSCFGIAGNNVWEYCFTLSAGSIDAANVNASVTACSLGGCDTEADTSNRTVDNEPPTVSTGAISVTGATGTGGAFKLSDSPVGRWDDSATGDNNSDTISSVIFNLSNFKSGDASRTGSNSSDIWTASLSGAMDSQGDSNNNTTVTVTDNAGNQTVTIGTNNYTVDTIIPTINSITSVADDAAPPYYDLTDNNSTVVVYDTTDTGTGLSACRFDDQNVAYSSMDGTSCGLNNCIFTYGGDGSKTVYLSCIDGAGNASTPNTQVDYMIDGSGPTGTSISALSTRIINSSYPAFVVDDGTDVGTGINTATRLLERREATYSNNSCGSFGDYETVTYTGTYPNLSDETVSGSKCYQYRWSVSDNAGHASSATTAAIVRVPLTTLAMTAGNNQSYGATSNPIGYTLPTPLQVRATDGGTNTALADDVTVNFAIISFPALPTATGQSLSVASDNTDDSGYAEVSLTLGDRAGIYQVQATSNSAAISNSVIFTATEENFIDVVVLPTDFTINLDPVNNPDDFVQPGFSVTTNAASYDIYLNLNQWPTTGSNQILNWLSSLGFGWSLNGGAITVFSELVGEPHSTLVYSCSGDTCQGAQLIDIDFHVAIDFTYPDGTYTNVIEYKAQNINY